MENQENKNSSDLRLPPIAPHKVYSKNSILWFTFFLGPMAGSYMVAENFKSFGNKIFAKKTWIFFIFLMAVFSVFILISEIVSFNIPDNYKYIIPVIYTLLVYNYAIKYQGKNIDEHIINGGQKYSIWRSIFVSLVIFLITIVYLVILGVLVWLLKSLLGLY